MGVKTESFNGKDLQLWNHVPFFFFCSVQQRSFPKCVPRVQHDFLSSFNQWDSDLFNEENNAYAAHAARILVHLFCNMQNNFVKSYLSFYVNVS